MTDLSELLDIVRSRAARRLRLSVDRRSGRIRLTLPVRAAMGPALQWAESQRPWIERQQNRLPDPWPIVPAMLVPFAGKDYWLDWDAAHRRQPRVVDDMIQIGGPRDQVPQRLLRWLRAEAKLQLARETQEIAERGGLKVGEISVGDPTSRWGSCAASGNIRYSWRLILAPDYVRVATVAHEVAHLRFMDHSPAFHAEVARLFAGDPKPARQWLRTHGARLHWFGKTSS